MTRGLTSKGSSFFLLKVFRKKSKFNPVKVILSWFNTTSYLFHLHQPSIKTPSSLKIIIFSTFNSRKSLKMTQCVMISHHYLFFSVPYFSHKHTHMSFCRTLCENTNKACLKHPSYKYMCSTIQHWYKKCRITMMKDYTYTLFYDKKKFNLLWWSSSSFSSVLVL